MPATSVTNAESIKPLLLAVLTAAIVALSGCGSSDTAVSADGGSNGSGRGGEQTNPGDGTDGEDAGNGESDDGEADGGSVGDGNGETGGMAPLTGDELMPVPSATPVTKTYSCKSEAPNEVDIALNLELAFDPATLEFAVDGDTVLTGGFTWNESSAEWVASTSQFLTNDANLEIFAKVAVDQMPTYFRRKLTQADFSFVQTECYQGLDVGNS